MHREARVAVVEADDQAHRDLVLAHRVDERAAELAVLGREPQRPAHRVDHAVERLLDLPDLLDAELPLLRVLGAEVEVADRRAGQVALGALAEHGGLGDQVRAGLEVRQLLAVAAAALVARADADHAPVLDEQLGRRGLAEDVHARLLGLLGEPAAELRDRGDVVAVVAERRRRRLQRDRALAVGQQVDRVLRHRAVGGPVLLGQVREQLLHRRRLHHRARQQVRARGPCPSRPARPAPRRATRAGSRPRRAAASAGSRRRARPGRRPRSPRPPRSARPRDRRAARRTPCRSRRAAGTRSERSTLL